MELRVISNDNRRPIGGLEEVWTTVPLIHGGADAAILEMLNAGDIVLTDDRALAAACSENGATPLRSDGSVFAPAIPIDRKKQKLRKMSDDERERANGVRRQLLELRIANVIASLNAAPEMRKREERALASELREMISERDISKSKPANDSARNRQNRRLDEQASRARTQRIETIKSLRQPREPRDRPPKRSLIEAAYDSETLEAFGEYEFEHRDEYHAWKEARKEAEKRRQREAEREREASERAEHMLFMVEVAASAINAGRLAIADGIYKSAAAFAARAADPDEAARLSDMADSIMANMTRAEAEEEKRIDAYRIANEKYEAENRARRLDMLKKDAVAAEQNGNWKRAVQIYRKARELAKDIANQDETARLAESLSHAEAAELKRAKEQQWMRNELRKQVLTWQKSGDDHIVKNHDDTLRQLFPDLSAYHSTQLVYNTLFNMLATNTRPKYRDGFRNYLKSGIKANKLTPHYPNVLDCLEKLGLLKVESDCINYKF
jgi:hypothetical protein